MRFESAFIDRAWSSPFVRWQGPFADVSSLELAEQVTAKALEGYDLETIDELVLGFTVPQYQSFYGAPTLAARLGLQVGGPMIMQACATSVACVHDAAAGLGGGGVRLVVTTDRTSNGPHLVYPAVKS